MTTKLLPFASGITNKTGRLIIWPSRQRIVLPEPPEKPVAEFCDEGVHIALYHNEDGTQRLERSYTTIIDNEDIALRMYDEMVMMEQVVGEEPIGESESW